MLVPPRRAADRATPAPARARSGPRCWSRPPRPARACRSSWRRSTAIGRPAATGRPASARLARAEAQVWAILADRLARPRSRDPARAARRAPSSTRSPSHRLDPYAAADRLLEAARAGAADVTSAGAVSARAAARSRRRSSAWLAARSCSSSRAGIVLPVAPRFATAPLGADEVGAGIAYRRIRRRGARCSGRSSAGRRIGSAGGRCSSAAALIVGRGARAPPRRRRPRAVHRRARAARDRRGVLLRRRPRGRRATSRRRSGAARRSTSLSLSLYLGLGDRAGRSARPSSAPAGFTAVWLAARGAHRDRGRCCRWLVPETAPTVLRPTRRAPAAVAADPSGRALPGHPDPRRHVGDGRLPRVPAALRRTLGIGGGEPALAIYASS